MYLGMHVGCVPLLFPLYQRIIIWTWLGVVIAGSQHHGEMSWG
jgi:hypothetical protein